MGSYPAPSLDEAKRGIYLDFEGRPTHHPVLLGCAYSPAGDSEVVVGQALVGAWQDDQAVNRVISRLPQEGRLPRQKLHTVLNGLLDIAANEERRVLSYSHHELRVIEAHAPDLLPRTRALFRDAKKGLKRWWYLEFSDQPPEDKHRLQQYLALLGCGEYVSYEPKFVGGVVSDFESAVENPDESLPVGFGSQWLSALRKNQADCEGLRCAIIRALEALE